MASALQILTTALFFFSIPVALANQDIFYTPGPQATVGDFSENPVWPAGSSHNITFSTGYSAFSLVVWQNNNDDFEYLMKNVTEPFYYYWNPVATNKDLSDGIVFMLGVFDEVGDSTDSPFLSHYINITAGTLYGTTTSSAASTATNTASGNAASTLASTTGTGKASSTSSSSSGGSSSKVGLGVGIGVGVGAALIIVGLAWYLLARRHRRKLQAASSYQPANADTDAAKGYYAGYTDASPSSAPAQTGPMQEVASQEVHEMPTESYK